MLLGVAWPMLDVGKLAEEVNVRFGDVERVERSEYEDLLAISLQASMSSWEWWSRGCVVRIMQKTGM